MLISPLDTEIVDFGTAIANLILLVEVSKLIAGVLLDLLARGDFSFDFTGCNWVVTSVELVELLINTLRNCDGFHCAVNTVFSAVRIDLR